MAKKDKERIIMKRQFIFLSLQFLAFSTFAQTKPLLKGEFRYTCGISCYETFIFDGDHTYQYAVWGDTVLCIGEYSVSKNSVKLTPVKFNSELKSINELSLNQTDDGVIVICRKERISLFKKRKIVYLKQ